MVGASVHVKSEKGYEEDNEPIQKQKTYGINDDIVEDLDEDREVGNGDPVEVNAADKSSALSLGVDFNNIVDKETAAGLASGSVHINKDNIRDTKVSSQYVKGLQDERSTML